MKILISVSLIISFFLFPFLSQAQKAQDLLGTWKVNWEQTLQVMKAENKNSYQSFKDANATKSNFEKLFKEREWQFGNNKKFKMIWTESKMEIQGTWEIKNQVLEIKTAGDVLRFRIEQFKDKRLILNEEGSVGMFDKFCLIKK